uniref:3-hydroxyacyl-CoA dehydrogenase type-2 n=1 Tax=Schistocephalus solidus TaxID=70667 RepID=A0A0X3PND5_SCHSO
MKLSMSLFSSLKPLTALVTGGASGLGLATCKKLLGIGYRVVALDVTNSDELKDLGENFLFARCDVTSEEDITSALELTRKQFSSINALVNCAGIGITRKTINIVSKTAHDPEEFERVFRVNTFGTFNTIRLAALHMTENEPDEDGQRGVIVNTASVAAFDGQVGQVAYAASKGAIVGMTLPIARDLSRHGIRVVTIAPGVFDTPMLASMPRSVANHLIRQIIFPKRPGRPEEFAHLVSCVLQNSMLNGEVIRLDGALRMPP